VAGPEETSRETSLEPARTFISTYLVASGRVRRVPATVLLGVNVGVLGLTGCGGSSSTTATTSSTTTASGTTTTDWANGFCTAYTTWKNSIESIGKQVASSPSKKSLETAASDLETATQTFASDLKGLGKPDTQSGQAAKNSVDKLATTLQADASKISETVKGVSGVTGVVSAAANVNRTLTAMGSAVTSTLQTLQNANVKGDLKSAFDQAPACRGVTSSG
jgi:hypothetical protein